MNIEKEIYLYILNLIKNEKVTYYFQNLDLLDTYSCGIFLLGNDYTYRSISKKKYKQYTNKLVLNLNTDATTEGFEFGFIYGEYINNILSQVTNTYISEHIFISYISIDTNTVYLGKREQGINKFSYNFTIYYSVI